MSSSVPNEHIAALGKASIDSAYAVLNASLDSLERVASHGLNTLRSALAAHADNSRELLGARDLHEVYSIHGSQFQPHAERVVSFYRGLYEISADTQERIAKLLEAYVGEVNKSISATLDWFSTSSANSDVAVAAFKSAISAANSAFEQANKTARQVAEITGASVNAATTATVRAVGSTTPARTRKAA